MGTLQRFLRLESLSGILLVAAALAGIAVANSPWSSTYTDVLSTTFTAGFGGSEFARWFEGAFGGSTLSKPLLLWINDGLMAVFFLLVALELKREVLEGELSNRSQILLPLIAAFGGIAVPAGVYVLVNQGSPEALRGWAIPAATDIAFALGVLALVGDRVPRSLKTFLLSLAVFDDLGAILIIAAFYTEEISWAMKVGGLVVTGLLVLLNLLGVRRMGVYVALGIVLWLFVLKSGVHATLAGVVLGLTIPLRGPAGTKPMLRTLEHALHPYVAVLVVPIFAFANAGVDLRGLGAEDLLNPIAVGIAGGLILGKTIGVFVLAQLAFRLGVSRRPDDWTHTALLGTSVLAGVGFTMSLFIGTLAFEDAGPDTAAAVRLGVLGGSFVAATLGFLLVRSGTRNNSIVAPDGAGH